jgi:hypothetical protein
LPPHQFIITVCAHCPQLEQQQQQAQDLRNKLESRVQLPQAAVGGQLLQTRSKYVLGCAHARTVAISYLQACHQSNANIDQNPDIAIKAIKYLVMSCLTLFVTNSFCALLPV